jgi:hypothetical protein
LQEGAADEEPYQSTDQTTNQASDTGTVETTNQGPDEKPDERADEKPNQASNAGTVDKSN